MARARSKSREIAAMSTFSPKTLRPDFVPMHPNAVHNAEREHDHERERTAVTDERQWHTSDRQNRNGHANVLKNVRENKRRDSNHQEQTKLVARKKCDEKTSQE